MFLLLNVNIISYSQEIFPLANAKWTEVFWDGSDLIQYSSYVLQGDTTIDDVSRSKLYYIWDINRRDSLLVGFIHTQGSTVFYRQESDYMGADACDEYYRKDYPLYTFSLSVGDKLNGCYHDCYVSNIDSIELGGVSRKRITYRDSDCEYCQDCDQWIEGMGSINGLFYGKKKVKTSETSNNFVCFTLNDELVYLNPMFSECPVTHFNSIPEVKKNSLIVFSNPMNSTVTVQFGQPLKLIQIFNLNGILLCERPCNGELSVVVHNQSLSSGIYFVKCILQNGNVETKKLFIQ